MAHYATSSRWNAEKVRAAAEAYFGAGGLGLQNNSQDECCLSFTGGGGYVSITIIEADGKSEVELNVSEWDARIPAFLRKIS